MDEIKSVDQLKEEVILLKSKLSQEREKARDAEHARDKDILEIISAIDRTDGSMSQVKEFCHLLLREKLSRSGRWNGKEKTECGIHKPKDDKDDEILRLKKELAEREAEIDRLKDNCDQADKNSECQREIILNDSAKMRSLQSDVLRMTEALQWMSGSEDFQLEGKAREGFEKLVLPILKGPTPNTSYLDALVRVFEAAKGWKEKRELVDRGTQFAIEFQYQEIELAALVEAVEKARQ